MLANLSVKRQVSGSMAYHSHAGCLLFYNIYGVFIDLYVLVRNLRINFLPSNEYFFFKGALHTIFFYSSLLLISQCS